MNTRPDDTSRIRVSVAAIETLLMAIGFGLVVGGVALFDARLAVIVAGLVLVVITTDFQPRRRA